MIRDIVVGLKEDGSCDNIEPMKEKSFSFLFKGLFVLYQVMLDPYEAPRVDVVVRLPSGLDISWSGVFHTGPVRVRELMTEGTRVWVTMRNISDDVVRARIVLRGDV